MRDKSIIKKILKILIFLIIIFVFLFPIYWMLVTSLKTSGEILQFPPTLIPKDITFENYINVFKKVPMLSFFKNSLLVAFAVTIVSIFTSTLGGYVFAKFKFKGKNIIFLTILSTIMIPITVIVIPLYMMTISVGLKNSLWALIIPGFVSALGIFLIRNYLASVPNSYIESARIDGCSEFGIYWKIILPLLKPAIAAIAIFIFMGNWNSFFWPLIVIDDLSKRTLPLGVGLFTQAFGVQSWNLIMAASLISVVPVLIIFLFLQNFFIKGITLSGLKG